MLEKIITKPLAEVPLLVFDTETTGLFPDTGDRIVEIGAVRLENWQRVGEMNQLLQPDRQMGSGASRVNGIYDRDLIGQPRFADVAKCLLELMEGAVIVAHNAAFDASFLGAELAISGLGDTKDQILPNPWLCTMLLARRRFHFGRNSLAVVARQLGVGLIQTHRALDDVLMTAEVLKRMDKQLSRRQQQTVGDLFYAQGGALYTPRPSRISLPEAIQHALDNKLDLRIEYAGAQARVSRRRITPRYASQRKGYIYLVAYCHVARDQRTFRLDRIRRIEVDF